jgi:dihydroflavonol-4-reductase
MKAFVTGGTGFVGQHLIRRLLELGYEVNALARSPRSAAFVSRLGATAVPGDITDTESMRPGMAGCDVVFHLAAWYQVGGADWAKAEAINVGGTRRVLRLAYEMKIPKIIYTSTVAVFGDTHGQLVDETFYQGGPFLTEYDRTKWLAHYKVAIPLIEKGAPIIIVQPGAIYGPGDKSFVADLMRMFYRGMPAVVGPEFTATYAHVEDIVEGHILAAEKGTIGESYILAGPDVPLGDLIEFWGQLLGKQPPASRIPATALQPFVPLLQTVETFTPLPSMFSAEAVSTLKATYIARSDKARQELGWQTRSLQTGMLETFQWIAETEPEPEETNREKQFAGAVLLVALLAIFIWLLGRKKE